ncbi:MAG: hypothetical protein ACYC2U_00320 [Candidatus Amoebophilus sp.]
MSLFINKNQIIKILFFTFLPISSICAYSPVHGKSDNGFTWQNIRINLDLGFGRLAYGTSEFRKKEEPIGYSVLKATTIPNYSLRIIGGYSFHSSNNQKLGIETGIGYGSYKSVKIQQVGITFRENHIKLPLIITILQTYSTSFYLAQTMMLGYEFNIILNSVYKQSGNYNDLHTSMQGDKDIQKLIPDFSRLSGSFLLGTRLELPKGVYLAANITFPVEIFKTMFGNFNKDATRMNSYFVDEMRKASTHFLTFNLGVNIVDCFFLKS